MSQDLDFLFQTSKQWSPDLARRLFQLISREEPQGKDNIIICDRHKESHGPPFEECIDTFVSRVRGGENAALAKRIRWPRHQLRLPTYLGVSVHPCPGALMVQFSTEMGAFFRHADRPEDEVVSENLSEMMRILRDAYGILEPALGVGDGDYSTDFTDLIYGCKLSLERLVNSRGEPKKPFAIFLGPTLVREIGVGRVARTPAHSIEKLRDGGYLILTAPAPTGFPPADSLRHLLDATGAGTR